VILACTVFDWSTRVTDRQTDRQRELRWLRRAKAPSSFRAKKRNVQQKTSRTCLRLYKIQVGYTSLVHLGLHLIWEMSMRNKFTFKVSAYVTVYQKSILVWSF